MCFSDTGGKLGEGEGVPVAITTDKGAFPE